MRNYLGQFSFFTVNWSTMSELSDVILDKILINGWPIWLEFIYRASILAKMSLKALWEIFFFEHSLGLVEWTRYSVPALVSA